MSDRFQKLIDLFSKLPGIGPRQATRLVLSMLHWPESRLAEFAQSIETLKQGTFLCKQCFNLSDANLCQICSDHKRRQNHIAIVEKITDLTSMEKTGAFNGVYHVLGGVINPIDNMVPENLKIMELIDRVKKISDEYDTVEVTLATSSTTYGDTTALYIEEELMPLNIKITRLARGLAAGSTLEYADEMTLVNALRDRR